MRTTATERVLELSCERLYVRWADARSGRGRGEPAGFAAPPTQPWEGEPPLEVATASPESVFGELERSLAAADVLRLRDIDWLSDATFALEVEVRVEAFRSRGGRVE